MSCSTPTPTAESIAHDLMDYLRANPGVCAKSMNVHGWRFIRYHPTDDSWQALACGGEHRLPGYIAGKTLDPETVAKIFVTKPIQIIPQSEANNIRTGEKTMWEAADEDGVFDDVDRCFWCGVSEQSADLSLEDTHDHGEIHLCAECRESWANADELVDTPTEKPA